MVRLGVVKQLSQELCQFAFIAFVAIKFFADHCFATYLGQEFVDDSIQWPYRGKRDVFCFAGISLAPNEVASLC